MSIQKYTTNFFKIIKQTTANWFKSEPFKLSAIVAYYAILSLPALIVIILNLVGNVWGKEIVQGELLDEITKAVGAKTAESIRVMMLERGNESVSIFTTVIGFSTLIYGATGVFYQLQEAFDKIWETKQTENTNGIIKIIISRIKSFGFILIIGFLLLISFILTSLISTFSNRIEKFVPDNLFEYVYLVDFLMSILFIYLLFAAMFKYLPTKKVRWKAVKFGAALTAILFVMGKYLLAWYFNKMQPGSTYGAAGSVILIMLWVSYSSLILFFGANFTKVYADFYLSNQNRS
ncbi:YihY/virulence factor BrkB family protein [Polaribacter sp.]|uniref:YihY/virulence factor BrkB family protein n=1 Tax=Polaribacter sp. TaxID=1920175 RepID=UPI003F6BE22A